MCIEQEMDGAAIAYGLASCPGPNWLQDVIPKVGLRLKVHHALVKLCTECQVKTDNYDIANDYYGGLGSCEVGLAAPASGCLL